MSIQTMGTNPAAQAALEQPFTYRGLAAASAAAALSGELFVVADDETNALTVYRRGHSDPVAKLDLANVLNTDADQESDLEGAATMGERTYWISSHGRNAKGEPQPHRHRFFATELWIESGTRRTALIPVGRPYSGLLDDLVASEALQPYRLEEAAAHAPEAEHGLNIEGLAAAPDGKSLLIGLRNPAPRGMALVVPLLNPDVVLQGEPAQFGPAIELDLGGMAVRSMDLVDQAYLIGAGPPGDTGAFALYRWSGRPDEAPVRLEYELGTLRPEALFWIPGTRQVQILSDDGALHTKSLPKEQQEFRSVLMNL